MITVDMLFLGIPSSTSHPTTPPITTYITRVLGTAWTGGDVSARYQRDRIAAQKKVDGDTTAAQASVVKSPEINPKYAEEQAHSSLRQVLEDKENGGPQILQEEIREEKGVKQASRRSIRRKSGFDAKSISDHIAGLHSRSPAILHADGMH